MSDTPTRPFVVCRNPDHDDPAPAAILHIEFPGGRWHPTGCCRDCLLIVVENLIDEPEHVVFTSIGKGSSS